MKILMFSPGSWIHSERTVKCLLESGQEVTLVDSNNPFPEGREGFEFIRYPRSGVRHYQRFIGSSISDQFSFWLTVSQLKLLWRNIKPDVVHVCWLDLRAYHCLKAGLRPLVLSVWGTDVNANLLPGADPDEKGIASRSLAGADLTIVDAPDMSEKCAILAGREIMTEHLHLGVNTKIFRPGYSEVTIEWRRRLQIPQDAKVIVSIRALSSNYNHHLIMDAFAQALERVRTNTFLVFKVYNVLDDSYEMELRRRAERLGIENSVRWIEDLPFPKVPEIYALADVIINYPTMDAFPVTFMEAAACERPVITCRLASYSGSFAEQYFRMVEPENVGALSGAIVEFIGQTPHEIDQAKAELARARQVVEEEFDEALFAGRLIDIYKSVQIIEGIHHKNHKRDKKHNRDFFFLTLCFLSLL